MSAKRRKAFGRPQKFSSKKTAKRLLIKKERLEALAKRRQHVPVSKKMAKRN